MLSDLKNKKGFTIIELIISIFILSVAVIGIFNAYSIMVILTSDSADRFTATYLAQEGMEIVRNIRDTNWLNMNAGVTGATWVDGLTTAGANNSVDCTNGCNADYQSVKMVPQAGDSSDYLNTDKNGFYSYGTGAPSRFKRKIIITPITDVDGNSQHIIKVTTEVSWNEKANILYPACTAGDCLSPNCCVTTEETLYDWYNFTEDQNSGDVVMSTNPNYAVDNINGIINIPSDTTSANLSDGLKSAAGDTLTVYQSNGTTPATDPIVAGDELIVSEPGGQIAAIYTITVGNLSNPSNPPTLVSVISYKTHGSAGTFGIPMVLTAPIGVEDRVGGPTQLTLTFSGPIKQGGNYLASLAAGNTGSINSTDWSGANNSMLTLNLSGVTNAQIITVNINDVEDANTGASGSYQFQIGVLTGDVNGDGEVTSADTSDVVNNLGCSLSSSGGCIASDVNVDGNVSNSDVGIVINSLGSSLPSSN